MSLKYNYEINFNQVAQINPVVLNFSTAINWTNILPTVWTPSGKPVKGMWHKDNSRKRYYTVASSYLSTLPFAFDIETTKVSRPLPGTKKMIHHSYPYIWQALVNNTVIIGRTIDEFKQLTSIIATHLNLGIHDVRDKKGKIVKKSYEARFWVANLSYEFAHIHKHFKFTNVFAKKLRQPISATTEDGIIFQDALAISGTSLAGIPKQFNTPTKKLKGDLDYDKPRNTQTPLTAQERQYCINDVVILGEFSNYLQQAYIQNGLKIPQTKTGILRNDVKTAFKAIAQHKGYWDKGINSWLYSILPHTAEEFQTVQERLFRGGFTHANPAHAGKVLTDVNGVDFTSSYPAVILQKDFPMTAFVPVQPPQTLNEVANPMTYDPHSHQQVKAVSKGVYTFTNLRVTRGMGVESVSKLYEYLDNGNSEEKARMACGTLIVDNGKILFAGTATLHLTDADLRIFLKFYTWDKVVLTDYMVATAGKLPTYLTRIVCKYYQIKAELKDQCRKNNIDPDTLVAYKLAKAMVNSAYGMMCEKLHLENPDYNNGLWEDEEGYRNDFAYNESFEHIVFGDLDKLAAGKAGIKRILSPFWGVWVTAYARENLLNMVYEIGDDAVYCDTDSIYFLNVDKHMPKIDAYNKYIFNLNNSWTANVPDITPAYFEDLGAFELINKDGNYTRFKTLGAKRYLKEGPHLDKKTNTISIEIGQTIAGLPKGVLIEYSDHLNKDPFDIFEDNLTIPENFVNKNAHIYNPNPHSDIVTDEFGHTETMTSLSSVAIYPVGFSLGLADDYRSLLFRLFDGETVEEIIS